MRPHYRTVDEDELHVGVSDKGVLHPLPDAPLRPSGEAFVDAVPVAVLGREHPPRRSGTRHPQHRFDEALAILFVPNPYVGAIPQKGEKLCPFVWRYFPVWHASIIQVNSLCQHYLDHLNAIRWDLDGDGGVSSGNATNYANAFLSRAADMGCPTNSQDADNNDCTGYELAENLDFDTDGDGDVDSNDAYPNWTPIPSFGSTLEGNGNTISNLSINSSVKQCGAFRHSGKRLFVVKSRRCSEPGDD